MLHFQYISSGISREDYRNYITREVISINDNTSYKYEKNDPNTYKILKAFGNQEQAIKWAQKLEKQFNDKLFANHNPCTKVYELILELTNTDYALSKLVKDTDSCV